MRPATFCRFFKIRPAGLALALMVFAGFLTSCETTKPETPAGEDVFKFSVLLYHDPVLVAGWKYDLAQSANPEGAALNIVTAMQHGDWDNWQTSWDSAEQPKASPTERAAILDRWQRFKDGQVLLLGRVIAGVDVVVEVAIRNPQTKTEEKLHLPLKRSNDQWWQTAMDPNSEFLNWTTATNKTVTYRNSFALENYLSDVKRKQH